MNPIANRVLEIVETELETKLELSQDLFDNGLDSLGVLRLLAMLEDEFSIVIPDEELVLENFQTPKNLVDLVRKYV
ncbi:acyl carrier protein [Oscillospiraceae bacterium 21-37]